ncbi:sulfatase-like hydrolase/transferase [Campylobacter sp. JMF_06 NA1]|uniref:sulfatase-like hydrolase/transferase n=1 Tax=Campylobacter sp. JMF_06 NA1 TaxID=2983823 RepID=UPI0022EA0733|nr:sulfatase-like hydrolase/transferase [Campylobacter sp. JMF_06 NA1]MDA3077943.1 sulfatase-like hydrolase/transferase [Campylobacter sp. JMF_06 NA1]
MISLILFFIFLVALFFVQSAKFRVFGVVLTFLFLVITIFNYTAYFYTGHFLNLSLINLLAISLEGAPMMSFWREILIVVLVLVCVVLFCIMLWQRLKRRENSIKFCAILAIASYILAIVFNPLTKSCVEIFQILNPKYHKEARAMLQKYIVKPKINPNFKNKNIVYIYLESFSRDFTTEFVGLTPNINALTNRLDFTNINQLSGVWGGASVTIEGLFASQCAFPFGFFRKPKKGENTVAEAKKVNFPTKISCATQILQDQGYYTYFIKGAPLNYQRTKELLSNQNYNETKGFDELKNQGAKSKNEWGVDDDEMFEFAWRDFERLSQRGDKFIQVVLNVGMHVPNGFISKSCENLAFPYNEKMLKAVHCTDYLVGKFIGKIRSSQYGKNTIIVIQSDHLMPYTFTDIKDENLEDSKLFFTILDDDIAGVQKVENYGSSLDTFTTFLGYIGVIDKMNLGRNILKIPSINSEQDIRYIYNTAISSFDDLDYKER